MSRAVAAGLLAAVLLGLPALSAGQDGTNPITGITVNEEANETVVTISLARTPTFSVFKLDDPIRLFVDVSQGDVAQVGDPLIVDNGVLDQVGTLQFRSQGVPVGRVIIGLREHAAYDVAAQDNRLIVRIDARNRRATTAEAGALAREVTTVREQLRREQQLLEQIRAERARNEELRAQEAAVRMEAERLRTEAQRMKDEAQVAAAAEQQRVASLQEEARQAREAAQRAQGEAKATAEAERLRLEALKAESAQAQTEKARLEQARKDEAQRLEVLKAQKALAEKEQEAVAAAAAAERRKLEAQEAATRQATAQRQAQEEATRQAEQSRLMAQAALATETERLAAVRAQREAEEAHAAAVRELSRNEGEALAQAQAARAKEESLLAELAAARQGEAAARARVEAERTEVANQELATLRTRIAQLEQTLDADRQQAQAQEAARGDALRQAQSLVASKEGELDRSRAEAARLEQRVAELAAERDRLAARAAAAEADAQALAGGARTAQADLARAEEAEQKARALEAQLAEQRAQNASLLARAERVSADYEATAVRLANEERRLAEIEARRVEAERRLATLRGEVDRMQGRAVTESDEARALRERLEAREAELARARQEVVEARRATAGDQEAAARVSELEQQLTARERELSDLRASYEAALDRVRAEVATVKAQEAGAREREAKASAQVERLEQELAQARERQAATPEPAKPVAKAEPPRAPKVPQIRSIEFQDGRNGPSVVVVTDGAAPEATVAAGQRSYEMTLRGVALPTHLTRRMDVTAFESAVAAVSAFTADDGTVKIIVDLDRPIGQNVRKAPDGLAWTFAGPGPASMMAGTAQPPKAAPATPQRVAQAAAPSMVPAASAAATAPAATTDQTPEYLKPSMVPKKKKYTGRRINLTVKDADIQNVLTFLAREGKVNIVTSEEVRGKVTFHLEDVPWDLALDTVLKAKGLDYVVEQGIYRVAPILALQKEFEAQIEKQKQQRELKPIIVRLVPINYSSGEDLLQRIKSILSPRGSAEVDLRTNTLIIKDTEDFLTAAEDLIRRLDQQTPQILIEARIVEARTTFSEDIGIQWGGRYAMSGALGNETGLVFPSSVGLAGGAEPADPSGGMFTDNPNWVVNLPAAVGQGAGGAVGIQLGSIGGAANLTLRLSAAEAEGDVKIISSPRISTLDNRKATISQGVSIPISVVSAAGVNTQFFSADLRLDVLPHVTRDGHISLKIDISKNEPDFGNVAANGNPTIQKKEAHTELLIRDGDTTVIGGIYTRNTSKSYKKIPLLGDIPVLGWLFKSRARSDDRSELLIFITPKIVNREVAL
jgi:type IV pilus assembly protein PilQ